MSGLLLDFSPDWQVRNKNQSERTHQKTLKFLESKLYCAAQKKVILVFETKSPLGVAL